MSASYNVGAGTGLFICKEGKLLMCLRKGAHGAGTWAPPGGKIEHGEDPAATAAREAKEESNLEVSDLEYLGFTNDVFEEGLHYITLWYASSKFEGEARIMEPEKCTEQKWMSLDELPSTLFLSTEHALEDPYIRTQLEKIMEITK